MPPAGAAGSLKAGGSADEDIGESDVIAIMRILIVSNLFPPMTFGGYEAVCAEVAERLGGHHEVTVLTSAPGRGHDAVREVVPGVRVLRVLPLLEPTPRDSLRAPLASIDAAQRTRRVLAETRPDLVFAWNGAGIPQAALRVLERSGAMIAYSVAEHWFGHMYRSDQFLRHLFGGDRGVRRAWALLMRAVNRLHPALRLEFERRVPAAIIWNSEYMMRATPVPPTLEPMVQRVSYPATSRHALFSQVERRPAAVPTILFVGRLEPAKGPDVAYRALDELRRRHGLDARLVMAGAATPAQERELAALATELSLGDRIEHAGRLGPEALAERFGEAHAFVVPSRWEEPFGLVATEAALARVPVVAARSGGLPEALLEDRHALFFDKGDHVACADALASILRDPEAAQPRVEAAHRHADAFTSERHLDEMEAFVDLAAATLARHERSPA